MNLKKFIQENQEKTILLLILFIGAILRFYNITGLSLSNDEFSAIARAQLSPFSEFISKGICADIHPAGIEFFIYLWIKIFGTSVFMIRLPFVIAGIFSIYFAYLVASRWFNKYAGLYAAATICFLEFTLLYSQLARPFTPAFLFTLMAVWYWTKMLFDEGTNKKSIFALALSFSAAAYCHYFAGVMMIMIIVTGFFFLKRSSAKAYFSSIVLAIIFYIPNIFVIISQIKNLASISWLSEPDGNWIFNHIYFIFNDSLILLYAFIALFVMTNIISFTEIKLNKFHLLSALWFLIPFLFAFYYSVWVEPILENSMLLFSFVFFIFIVFSFVQKERKRFNFGAIIVLLLIGLTSTVIEKKYYNTYHFGEFRDIAAKAIAWSDDKGEKNITRVININSPYYINYYLNKAEKPLSFAMYRIEEKEDLHTLDKIVQESKTPYFLYAWSSLADPNETSDIILSKYPYIISQDNYNEMAGITLYSMKDSSQAIHQQNPVYYLFNGFENKETWDKDTSIVSKEQVWEGKYSIRLDARDEYGPAFTKRISYMTDKPFKKIRISLWAYATGVFKDAQIVATINFKDEENQVFENYFWLSSKFSYFIDRNKWGQVFFSFDLPELHSRNDELKIYVWNPDKEPLYIDNFELKLFEK